MFGTAADKIVNYLKIFVGGVEMYKTGAKGRLQQGSPVLACPVLSGASLLSKTTGLNFLSGGGN